MAKLLDAFYFSLGLDKTNYDKGRAEAKAESADLVDSIQSDNDAIEKSDRKRSESDQKQHRDGQERRKQTRESFASVKREVVGFMAVLVGANSLRDYVATTTTSIAQMGRAAKIAGLETRDMAAFGKVIERNGGQAETARASLSRLAQTMNDWKTLGIIDPNTLTAFSRIGAQASDDPMEVYRKFAAWAEGQAPGLANQTGQWLGFDEAAIDQAMKGVRAYDTALADAYRSTPSEKQTKEVQELLRAWKDLTQGFKGAADEILYDLAPMLTKVLDFVSNGIRDFPELTKAVVGLGAAFLALGGINVTTGVLGLMTGAGGRAAGGAAGAAAGAASGGFWGAAARWFPWLGAAVGILWPDQANAGEAEAMERIRARGGNGDVPKDVAGRRDHARRFFMSKGWSAAEADGIVAGMIAENGKLDPLAANRAGGGRGAWGLGQWRGSRLDDFKARYGRDVWNSSFDEQIDFIDFELRQGKEQRAGRKMKGRSSRGVLESYILDYMRPAAGYETTSDLERGNRALQNMTTIGTVNIYATPGTDGAQVARDFKNEMRQPSLADWGNTGTM